MNGPATVRFGRVFFLLCAAVFILQTVPRLTSDPLVLDEEWDLANAIYYWHDLDASVENGPLPLTGSMLGLPSLWFPMRMAPLPTGYQVESRAYFFFYYLNPERSDIAVAACRVFNILFGIALGWMIYRLAASRGRVFLSVALLLWAFDPLIVGYSGVAKNDIPAAVFSLAALMVHQGSRRKAGAGRILAAGLLAGMAVLTKMTALFLLPAIATLEMLDAIRAGGRARLRLFLLRSGLFLLGMAVWIYAAYLPTTLAVEPHRQPFDLFGRYIQWSMPHGFRMINPYFLGQDRPSMAFMAFFVSVMFKCTLPFLILVILGLVLGFQRRILLPDYILVPLGAMALMLLPTLSSKMCRHLLPVYPFLILTAAGASEWLWERVRAGRIFFLKAAALFLIGAWHPLSATVNFPHALSYMNDLVPRHRKSFFLSGYNWDLNQDVKRLVVTARQRGWGTVKLANSARVDPHFFGLSWEPWTRLDLEAPQPGTVYVLNASLFGVSNMYLQDFAPVKRSWVATTPPTGWVSDTWFYFEVPGEPKRQDSPRVNSFPYYIYDLIPYRMGSRPPEK